MKILVSLIIVFILSGCHGKKPPKLKTGLEGKPMPAIELIALDSTHFNTKNIQTGRPTILFVFSPTCPYCRAQTRSIISNINSLKDINIYMVCISKSNSLSKFYSEFELDKYSNIKVAEDFNLSFTRYFKLTAVPYLVIYDRNKNLKQALEGKNNISTLKEIALK